jgi:glucose-6-phosphate 1-dehydrogenase
VQNLMAIRFGNMLFEPLWNTQYVDHVQITVAETVGVGGRGPYYDQLGRDARHGAEPLMQLLCLIAMEPPARFDPDAVRDEKLKVIRALDPVAPADIVRGQYAGQDEARLSRRDRKPGQPDRKLRRAEAACVELALGGHALLPAHRQAAAARVSEIAVIFKDPPHSIFGEDAGGRNECLVDPRAARRGHHLRVTIKEPGPGGMRLIEVPLDMSFAEALGDAGADIPDAYERLIMDVIRGNQTLFMRGDEVEAAWAWTDPVIAGWDARGDRPVAYEPGGAGPEEALALMHRDGRRWRAAPIGLPTRLPRMRRRCCA